MLNWINACLYYSTKQIFYQLKEYSMLLCTNPIFPISNENVMSGSGSIKQWRKRKTFSFLSAVMYHLSSRSKFSFFFFWREREATTKIFNEVVSQTGKTWFFMPDMDTISMVKKNPSGVLIQSFVQTSLLHGSYVQGSLHIIQMNL